MVGANPVRTAFRHGILILMSAITLIPILFTVLTSLKRFRDIVSGSLLFEPTLRNFILLFDPSQSNFLRLTLNSVNTAVGTTVIVMFVGSLTAYSLSRFRWKPVIRSFILGWLLFVHMLPPIIFVGPFYLITRTVGIYDSPLAVIMGHIVLNLPLAVFVLFDFFAAFPKELEDSAVIDGATRAQVFTKIALPLTKPGLTAAAVLSFVFSWKEFLYALSLTSTPQGMTIPVGIAGFVQEYNVRYGEMSAAAIFATIPGIILVLFAQRHIVKGMTLGAIKG